MKLRGEMLIIGALTPDLLTAQVKSHILPILLTNAITKPINLQTSKLKEKRINLPH